MDAQTLEFHAPNDDLRAKVHLALTRLPHRSQRCVDFESNNGRIVLRGQVGSFYEKQLAQEALRRVDGVEAITNDLEVCCA